MILRPEGTQNITSTGATSITQGVGKAMIGAGGTLATITITFPPNPNDRDNFLMFFNGAVTLMSLLAPVGSSILGSLPTSAATGACMCYEYDAVTTKWFRLY